LSGMVKGSDGKQLRVGDVFHKAVVEVNEERNWEAAASANPGCQSYRNRLSALQYRSVKTSDVLRRKTLETTYSCETYVALPDPTFLLSPQTLAPAAAAGCPLPHSPLSSSLPSPPSEDAAGEAVLPTTEAGPLAACSSRRASRRPAAAAVLVGVAACVCSARRARGCGWGRRVLRGVLRRPWAVLGVRARSGSGWA
jgi:hypothetical protein